MLSLLICSYILVSFSWSNQRIMCFMLHVRFHIEPWRTVSATWPHFGAISPHSEGFFSTTRWEIPILLHSYFVGVVKIPKYTCFRMNKILFEQVDVTLIDRDGHHHMANSFLLQLVFPVFRSIAASRHHKIKVVVVDASPQVVDLLVDWACGSDRSRTCLYTACLLTLFPI